MAADGERIVEVVGTNRLTDPGVKGMGLVLTDVTQHHRRADELTRRATRWDDRPPQSLRVRREAARSQAAGESVRSQSSTLTVSRRSTTHRPCCGRCSVDRDWSPDEDAFPMSGSHRGSDRWRRVRDHAPGGTVAELERIVEEAQASIAEPIRFGDVEIEVTASAGCSVETSEDALRLLTPRVRRQGTRGGARGGVLEEACEAATGCRRPDRSPAASERQTRDRGAD